jgi:hypothetical protein
LKYLSRLPGGEPYGFVRLKDLSRYTSKPDEAGAADSVDAPGEERLPLLIPGQQPRKGEDWYVFGTIESGETTEAGEKNCGGEENVPLPVRPQDPLVAYGAMPGNPEVLASRYTLAAYSREIAGGLLLLTGIGLNILFITMIAYLL